MFRVDKTSQSSKTLGNAQKTSTGATSMSAKLMFEASEVVRKEGYALLGLDIKVDPPKILLKNIEDTVSQKIIEDSAAQVKIAQGNKGAHWCAYTVSYFLRNNGVKIPVMPAVSQYVEWGTKNGRYHKVKSAELTRNNYKNQVKVKEAQVKSQISAIKEGDLIIWKSNSLRAVGNSVTIKPASHIGIVTQKRPDGKIVIAEGNANTYETKTINGVRGIRTEKKTNGADSLMKKTYDAHDLAVSGYSGYISMEGLCK